MRVRADATPAQSDLAPLRLLHHFRTGFTVEDRDNLVLIAAERTRRTLGATASTG
jgi:hypothetical protein